MSCLLPIFSTFGCSLKGWWSEPTQGRTPFHGRELTNCSIIFILPCVDTIYQGIGIDDKTMGALCLLLSVDVFQDSFSNEKPPNQSSIFAKVAWQVRMWTLHASLKTRDWIYFNFLEHCRLKIFVFIKLCYKENIANFCYSFTGMSSNHQPFSHQWNVLTHCTTETG